MLCPAAAAAAAVAGGGGGAGSNVSSEGVQRDLLPILEGSVVSTKYGNVSTEHVLFIASGAFHSAKPGDMLAELQVGFQDCCCCCCCCHNMCSHAPVSPPGSLLYDQLLMCKVLPVCQG
jgi:hypothetical protein